MEKTYLFVPGNQFEKIGKAIKSRADAVIIDLEDAVAISEKKRARQSIEMALNQLSYQEKSIYIRINDVKSEFWKEDVELVKQYPTAGIMLPKTETAEDIHQLVSQLQTKQKIIPLIETAKGITKVEEIICASQQVIRVAFGAIDYCLDVGISITEEQHELIFPRSTLVITSKAHGIGSPIDTVYVDIHNENGLRKETIIAQSLGMFAKLCIHPKQIDIVKNVLHPTEHELQWAKDVVLAFEKAEMEGIAAIHINGKMVDYPVYKKALTILNGH